jgi:hypothetical protein
MDFTDVALKVLGDFLGSINVTLSNYVDLPTNATGPLDPNIRLTDFGVAFVHELARLAVAWSATVAATIHSLV